MQAGGGTGAAIPRLADDAASTLGEVLLRTGGVASQAGLDGAAQALRQERAASVARSAVPNQAGRGSGGAAGGGGGGAAEAGEWAAVDEAPVGLDMAIGVINQGVARNLSVKFRVWNGRLLAPALVAHVGKPGTGKGNRMNAVARINADVFDMRVVMSEAPKTVNEALDGHYTFASAVYDAFDAKVLHEICASQEQLSMNEALQRRLAKREEEAAARREGRPPRLIPKLGDFEPDPARRTRLHILLDIDDCNIPEKDYKNVPSLVTLLRRNRHVYITPQWGAQNIQKHLPTVLRGLLNVITFPLSLSDKEARPIFTDCVAQTGLFKNCGHFQQALGGISRAPGITKYTCMVVVLPGQHSPDPTPQLFLWEPPSPSAQTGGYGAITSTTVMKMAWFMVPPRSANTGGFGVTLGGEEEAAAPARAGKKRCRPGTAAPSTAAAQPPRLDLQRTDEVVVEFPVDRRGKLLPHGRMRAAMRAETAPAAAPDPPP